MPQQKALVIFSGGQDSTTCLIQAIQTYGSENVEAITFQYGQRHAIELEKAHLIAADLGVPQTVLDLSLMQQITHNALMDDKAEIRTADSGTPNTFVDGRNALFLLYAAIYAKSRDIVHIITGVCETDFSGYPDCRDDTMKAMQLALSLGMDKRFLIETPLMWIDKADTWALAYTLGAQSGVPQGGQALVELIIEHTHTCYLGDRTHRHDWGYGCGECPACELRARGYQRYISQAVS